MALSHIHLRQFGEAMACARNALARDAHNERAEHVLTTLCFFTGDVPAFIAEKRRWAEACGGSLEAGAALNHWLTALQDAFARGGRQAATRLVLESLRETDDSLALVQRAACSAGLGDVDVAFQSLDRALALRDPYLVYLGVHPMWDPLRSDPRMDERLAGIGLSKQALRHS
jgi:hypothetical protein